jgi:hypothetical protein
MFRNGFVFRLIGILLLVGLMAFGGFMAYKTGVTAGIAQAPAVATAMSQSAENGQGMPWMYGYPHPYGFGYHPYLGYFPLGGICFSIFFLFLLFGVLRMVFFRTWRHTWGHPGSWGKHSEGNVPPIFDEWHKRAHEGGEKPTEDGGQKE